MVAVKSGLKDINSLVTIVHGKEKRLSYIGSINSRLDYRNGKIYWTEIVPGLRWTHENYSVLKCYDLKEGRIKSITPRQRYLSPSVDKNGKLHITKEANGSNPVRSGLTPLLGFDVWEHAYYLDYQNKRADHVNALWSIVDWDAVGKRMK